MQLNNKYLGPTCISDFISSVIIYRMWCFSIELRKRFWHLLLGIKISVNLTAKKYIITDDFRSRDRYVIGHGEETALTV